MRAVLVGSLLAVALSAQAPDPGGARRDADQAAPRASDLVARCAELADPDQRVAAYMSLWRAGPPVVPLLLREVQKGSASSRPALDLLARFGRAAAPARGQLERLHGTEAHRDHRAIGLALAAIGERDSITVASYTQGYIAEVDPTGVELRRVALPSVWAVDPLPGDRLLVTEISTNEVREIDWTGAVHWRAKVPSSPLDARRLADGTTVVATWNGGNVIWYDADGEMLRRTENVCAVDLEPLPSGNLLVCDYNGRRLVELDGAGEIVWQFAVPAQPMDADLLADGHLLVSLNMPNSVVEYARDGDGLRVVEERAMTEQPEDIHRLPDGRTVLTHDGGLSLFDAEWNELWRVKCGHGSQAIVRLSPER